jgi:hypothetical protein
MGCFVAARPRSYHTKQVNFAGGSPAASHFSCLAKKSNPKKAPPVCRPCGVPCVARLVRRLWNSRYALRQSSPTPPDQPALLGGAQGKEHRRCCARCAHVLFFEPSLSFATLGSRGYSCLKGMTANGQKQPFDGVFQLRKIWVIETICRE